MTNIYVNNILVADFNSDRSWNFDPDDLRKVEFRKLFFFKTFTRAAGITVLTSNFPEKSIKCQQSAKK